jgi:hypothetical protein
VIFITATPPLDWYRRGGYLIRHRIIESNRGLRSGLIETPVQVKALVAAFEASGVDFLLLQCSPQREEMERFARDVIH